MDIIYIYGYINKFMIVVEGEAFICPKYLFFDIIFCLVNALNSVVDIDYMD